MEGFKIATICLSVLSILLLIALIVVAIEYGIEKKLPKIPSNIVKPHTVVPSANVGTRPSVSHTENFATLRQIITASNFKSIPAGTYWFATDSTAKNDTIIIDSNHKYTLGNGQHQQYKYLCLNQCGWAPYVPPKSY